MTADGSRVDVNPPDVEQRYRRWLAAYPQRWRDANGEALLGTCLAAADADGRDRPTRAEVADLVVHGVAERARVVLPSEAALRPAAMLAVGLGTALSLSALVLGELLPPFREHQAFFTGMAGRLGAFSTTGPLLYVPFLLGAVATLAGATRAARVVLGTTALVAAALPVVSALAPVNRPPLGLVLALGWCALVAVAGLRRLPSAARAGAALGALAVAGATIAIGWPYVIGWGLGTVRVVYPDRYETLPFYRGETLNAVSVVLEVACLAVVVLAGVLALVSRSRHPIVAVLLVLPAALLALNRGGYWTAGLTRSELWPLLAFAAVATTLAVEGHARTRLDRRRPLS